MAEVRLGVHIHRGGRGRKAAEVGAGLTRKRRKRQRTKLRAWVQMRSAEKTEATKFMVSVGSLGKPTRALDTLQHWHVFKSEELASLSRHSSAHAAALVLTSPRRQFHSHFCYMKGPCAHSRPGPPSGHDTYLLQLLHPFVQTSRSRVSGVAVGPLPAPSHLLLCSHTAVTQNAGEKQNKQKKATKRCKNYTWIFQIPALTNTSAARGRRRG